MGNGGRTGALGRALLAGSVLALLAGCSSMDEAMPKMPQMPDISSWSCDRPGETSMLVAHLYMGGKVPGGTFIGEFEWQQFLAASVLPRFPKGVMSSDVALNYVGASGAGALQDNIKLLTIVTQGDDVTEGKLTAIVNDFRKHFPGQAVTLIESSDCSQSW